METTVRLEKLKLLVQSFLGSDSSGHDYYHCLRVASLAHQIAVVDAPNADREIIIAAALVHDMCRPWEKAVAKSHFSDEALELIEVELGKAGFSEAQIVAILAIVRWHDVYDPSAIPSSSIELRVHQDADRLDALGAIGIARAFSFGGAHGLPIYVPGERLDFEGFFIESPTHRTSIIAHFHEKLLRLRDQMHTPTGKRLAFERHERMEQFIDDFFKEWGIDLVKF